jgi:hypothetical protein
MHNNPLHQLIELMLSGAFALLALTLTIAGVAFDFLSPLCFILAGVCAYVSFRFMP